VEEVVEHLGEKGGRYEDLFDTAPLQLADEGIQLDHDSRERIRMNHFPVVSARNDDR
jgi:hypothetical protein